MSRIPVVHCEKADAKMQHKHCGVKCKISRAATVLSNYMRFSVQCSEHILTRQSS